MANSDIATPFSEEAWLAPLLFKVSRCAPESISTIYKGSKSIETDMNRPESVLG